MENDMSKYEYDDIDDAFEEKPSRKKKKKGLSSTSKWLIALFMELITLVLMGYGVFRIYLHDKYQKFDHVQDLKQEELEINEGVDQKIMEGYTTIALFGIDARAIAGDVDGLPRRIDGDVAAIQGFQRQPRMFFRQL